MLWILLKKQFAEVFKGCFFNAKRNKMRPWWAVVGWFALFLAIMLGVLGGMFTFLSLSLCGPLTKLGMGWLYFALMGGIATLLGMGGSVFNTYAGLYLAKDNDLLLSMPIPIGTIMAARLTNVYLMGAMYSATALLPALIVYWMVAGISAARAICGFALFMTVTLVVLLLSCALGWAVARISVTLKNKSLVAVLAFLLLMGGYWFFYFRAKDIVRDIVLNAATYGARIKDTARALYLFGRIGEGDWAAAAIFLAAAAALCALAWAVMTRSFLKLATDGGKSERARYSGKPVRQRSAFGALLCREFGRFTASANYMLNCGLATLFLPACGVLLLVKGRAVFQAISELPVDRPDAVAVLLCAAVCLISAMNDMAAPSVSLEGKCLWIPQSLPVSPRTVLRAKASAQAILTAPLALFASVCVAATLHAPIPVRLLLCAVPPAFALFSAAFDTAIGVSMPILTWTNEIAPIKQSAAVVIAMFGGWAVCLAFGAMYFLVGYRLGAASWLGLWTALLIAAALGLLRWLDTRGAARFAAL